MSRAQISSQVFVYILAAIIVGVILLIGYKSIATIMKAAEKAPIDNFKSAFTGKVAEMARGYGSRVKFTFTLPQKYDEICFIDSMGEDKRFHITAAVENEWIKDKVTENVPENVFFMKNGIIQNDAPFYVEDLDVLGDYMCLPNKGRIELWFESTGKLACMFKYQTDTCTP